ncbi:MAG TPA: hypothetical protein VMY77_03160 [Chitinophagaceae bacterium]|nr:hypothetical protein [Chitinophagaceae bacterium]
MNWLKNNALMLIILVMAVIIYFQRCNDKSTAVVSKTDTVVSVQYVPQKQQTIPPYQPIIIESKQPASIPQQYQASQDPNILLKQYLDAINKLLVVNYYKDTIRLKDSAGNDVGSVMSNDVVTENQIKSRDFSYALKIPQITRTITIQEGYKPKGQLFIGGSINGSPTNYVSAFEAGLMYKNKKDQLYGAKAGIGTTGGMYYGVQSYWKVKFRK